MPGVLAVYLQRKMLALLLLGFSGGLPAVLVAGTLQAWLTKAGLTLEDIGYASLIGLPYALKPLWAPFIDRFALPVLGRRRGWLLATQLGLVAALWWLARQDPVAGRDLFLAGAVAVAFLSATQDIVIDAYRADVLDERDSGAGIAGYVGGFRAAMVLANWLPLVLAAAVSWQAAYEVMAACIAIGLLGTVLAPEPPAPSDPPRGFHAVLVQPFTAFVARRGVGPALAVLAFVVLYKLADQLLGNVSMAFLLRGVGFTLDQVGAINATIGLAATIAGVAVGGAIQARIGIARSLWIFGVLQALSNLAYWWLSGIGHDLRALAAVIAVENACGGLVTAAFLGFLVIQCDLRWSATQFALLTALMTLARSLLAAPAGWLAERLGWTGFFLLTVAFALPGLALLPVFAPWRSRDAAPAKRDL